MDQLCDASKTLPIISYQPWAMTNPQTEDAPDFFKTLAHSLRVDTVVAKSSIKATFLSLTSEEFLTKKTFLTLACLCFFSRLNCGTVALVLNKLPETILIFKRFASALAKTSLWLTHLSL